MANDSSPSLLYHNDCKGNFTEVGAEAGVAYSADGREQAGMGIDSADYDLDGWPDIAKTNFSDDTNNLYHNDHTGQFTDLAGSAGFGPVSMPFLGFGVKFFDLRQRWLAGHFRRQRACESASRPALVWCDLCRAAPAVP